MADSTPTRAETVAANLASVKSVEGNDAYTKIIIQLLTDISTSLAMLVDNDSSSSNSSST